jgi:hypothetical protein
MVPVAPAWRAVVMASTTRLAAPRAEAALPPRNRAVVTTGAANGVDTAAINALGPRTSNNFDAIVAWPNSAPCLLAPLDPSLHRVDIDQGQRVRTG